MLSTLTKLSVPLMQRFIQYYNCKHTGVKKNLNGYGLSAYCVPGTVPPAFCGISV